MGLRDLTNDPRFRTRADRLQHRDILYAILEGAFLQKSGEEWLEFLEHRVPIGPINTLDRALTDPQILARNMVVEATHRSGEPMKLLGNLIKMSGGGKEEFTPPPYFGEYTNEVLTKLLNFNAEEIQRLRDKKIIISKEKPSQNIGKRYRKRLNKRTGVRAALPPLFHTTNGTPCAR